MEFRLDWVPATLPRPGLSPDPTYRYSHGVAQLSPTQVVVYGGISRDVESKADMQQKDVWLMTIHHSVAPDQTMQASVDWKRLRSVNFPNTGHNRNHTMIAVGEYVYVFGNRTCDQLKAEWFVKDDFEIQRFRVDTVTLSAYWEVVHYTTPRVIPPRLAHSTVLLEDGRIVTCGGRSVGKSIQDYNDLVIFNPTTDEAQHVTNLPFLARSFFSIAARGTDIYVHGGLSCGPDYKDHLVKSPSIIVKFNLDSPLTCTKIQFGPAAKDDRTCIQRFDHSMAWLDDKTLIVAGGKNKDRGIIFRQWAWDIETKEAVDVSQGLMPLQFTGGSLLSLDATTLICFGGKKGVPTSAHRKANMPHTGVHVGKAWKLPTTQELQHEMSQAKPLPAPPITPVSLLKRRRSTSDSPEAPQKRTRIPSAVPSLSEVRETQEESHPSITTIEPRQDMDNPALLKEVQALSQKIAEKDQQITTLSQQITALSQQVAAPEGYVQQIAELVKDTLSRDFRNIADEINQSAVNIMKGSERVEVLYAALHKHNNPDLSQSTVNSQEQSPPGPPVVRKSGNEAQTPRTASHQHRSMDDIRYPHNAMYELKASLDKKQYELALELIEDPATAHSFAKLHEGDRLEWVHRLLQKHLASQAIVHEALRLVETCKAEMSQANQYEYFAAKELVRDYAIAQAFVEVERDALIPWLKWKLMLASSSSQTKK
ncbi:hypothetical protein LEN26_008202 [Aphanomyces euteiches]|nr:hypothetical protein AeMF1_012621 [Aphanomyces euteiches]KAH9130781.1 hypothetical protein LEN26_008202 [Aphanomyces euteiches]KAH9187679.1 hypothetical protein AeNC1_010347 [Aphanomyces euteiches]